MALVCKDNIIVFISGGSSISTVVALVFVVASVLVLVFIFVAVVAVAFV